MSPMAGSQRGRVTSGTVVAVGLVLGGIILALVALRYRVLMPRDPAATRPATAPAASRPAEGAADLRQ